MQYVYMVVSMMPDSHEESVWYISANFIRAKKAFDEQEAFYYGYEEKEGEVTVFLVRAELDAPLEGILGEDIIEQKRVPWRPSM
jgi:hypothetical protein